MKIKSLLIILICMLFQQSWAQGKTHTFSLGTSEFLLDGKPFQIISGEMHPARIPVQYWRHRIQMAKAMGCNTIAAYVLTIIGLGSTAHRGSLHQSQK